MSQKRTTESKFIMEYRHYIDMKKDERMEKEYNKNCSAWKPTNPKDVVGIRKAPLSTLSWPVIYEMGVGMMEGALKYGRHNYRDAGVCFSTYLDATMRHLAACQEGEDIDPVSGLHHITKAMTSLMVLRDAMINDKLKDDRPIKVANPKWLEELNQKASELVDKYPDPVKPFTEKEI